MSRSVDQTASQLRLHTIDALKGSDTDKALIRNQIDQDERASDVTDLPKPNSPISASGVQDIRPKSVKRVQDQQFSRRGSARDIPGLSTPVPIKEVEKVNEQKDDEEKHKPSKPKKTLPDVLRPWILKNEGSVARDHMANERTFLAWIRSGLTILTLGIAFVQMYSISSRATWALMAGANEDERHLLEGENSGLEVLAKPLSILCGIFAAFMIIAGYWRYLKVQSALTNNQFPASRAMALVVVMLALVVWGLLLGLAIRTKTT